MNGLWDHHVPGIVKEIRRGVGKDIGDRVRVTLQRDHGQRVVEVPEVLMSALERDAKAREFFDGLSYAARKESALWISPATRKYAFQAAGRDA